MKPIMTKDDFEQLGAEGKPISCYEHPRPMICSVMYSKGNLVLSCPTCQKIIVLVRVGRSAKQKKLTVVHTGN